MVYFNTHFGPKLQSDIHDTGTGIHTAIVKVWMNVTELGI